MDPQYLLYLALVPNYLCISILFDFGMETWTGATLTCRLVVSWVVLFGFPKSRLSQNLNLKAKEDSVSSDG